jgi:hypothetical protein
MLEKLIPNKYLQYAHAAYAVAVVVVGALNVAEVHTGKALDVLAYVGAALGLGTAAAITTGPTKTDPAPNQD